MQICRTIIILVALSALALTGCTTKAKARTQARQAFEAGQKQAAQAAQTAPGQASAVTVVGQVRNRIVPWKEGMTLAEALDAAVYTGFTDPRVIRLGRGADFQDITPKDLLSGKTNPAVEAGDVVELRR